MAGILNDCILRRLYNDRELGDRQGSLPGTQQLAGFDLREILGLNSTRP